MFYFKACEKCKGDLYLDRDSYGAFLKCWQCGRIVDLEAKAPVLVKEATRKRKSQAA